MKYFDFDEKHLQAGTVFRMYYTSEESKPEKFRFFIILNNSPLTDKIIVIVTTTTKHIKRLSYHKENAENCLIGIHPNQYAYLNCFSVVDITNYKKYEKDEFLSMMKKNRAVFLPAIPKEILNEIQSKFLNSEEINMAMKRVIDKSL